MQSKEKIDLENETLNELNTEAHSDHCYIIKEATNFMEHTSESPNTSLAAIKKFLNYFISYRNVFTIKSDIKDSELESLPEKSVIQKLM